MLRKQHWRESWPWWRLKKATFFTWLPDKSRPAQLYRFQLLLLLQIKLRLPNLAFEASAILCPSLPPIWTRSSMKVSPGVFIHQFSGTHQGKDHGY